ncbi:sulfatase family protein [Aestuariimicrobium kwangyangense]|uniref:sulfatase family protein n=1 Tax=Aestuariimicrobium kwangyangense TaxID=396389 RepID=UPI0003FDE2C1|nr:sulfatase [Aestuariimicrobium kwangyangense]
MSRANPMRRPNIAFVMSDDHAAHAIGAYGSRINRTPQLDRLADEGALFEAVYCTNSVCAPSRATILTGTYSHLNGVRSIYEDFDYRLPTFPQVLQRKGYATALFGKWHLGEADENLPQGFDDWAIFRGQGEYFDPELITAEGSSHVEGYATDLITDLACDWIAGREPDQPFCLLLHHKAPHRPWEPHPRHADAYPVGTIPEPDTLFDDYETKPTAVKVARMRVSDDLTVTDVKEDVPAELLGEENRVERTRWNYQRYMRDYLGCIQAIDESMGRVLDSLDAAGVAEDTLVIYTSDQGFFLGDHGWYDKRFIYDESLQMPFLARWPRVIAPGTRVARSLTNVDFAATFLDLAGLGPADLPQQQGESFVPLFGDPAAGTGHADSVYYRYWEHDDPSHGAWSHYGVRTATHKLVYYYAAGLGVKGASDKVYPPEWELIDLVNDPQELVNVADDPQYAHVRAELERELARLQRHYNDEPYVG